MSQSLILQDEYLMDFSKKAALSHTWFHHFTSICGLKKILTNKQWKLSSAYSCNDLQEVGEKGIPEEWKRIFSISLSHGDEDCMGMWNTYGGKKLSQKIRITIPGKALSEWFNYLIAQPIGLFSNDKHLQHNTDYKLSMHDIIYSFGRQCGEDSTIAWDGLTHTLKRGDGTIYNPSSSLTGYIKNSAWEYERETRIMVKLNSNRPVDHLLVNIPETVIQQFKITVCPFYNPIDYKTYLERELNVTDPIVQQLTENAGISYFNGKVG